MSAVSLQWCHWLTITHYHCRQHDSQGTSSLETCQWLVWREQLSLKFKTETLNLTYPCEWREDAGLPHCPVPGEAPFNRILSRHRREQHKTTSFYTLPETEDVALGYNRSVPALQAMLLDNCFPMSMSWQGIFIFQRTLIFVWNHSHYLFLISS